MDTTGAPLPAPMEPGATAAPARVVMGGQTYLLPAPTAADDLDLLEAA